MTASAAPSRKGCEAPLQSIALTDERDARDDDETAKQLLRARDLAEPVERDEHCHDGH